MIAQDRVILPVSASDLSSPSNGELYYKSGDGKVYQYSGVAAAWRPLLTEALASSTYVTLGTTQTISGAKTFSSGVTLPADTWVSGGGMERLQFVTQTTVDGALEYKGGGTNGGTAIGHIWRNAAGTSVMTLTASGKLTATGAISASSGFQVAGVALAASNLSNGVTGSGAVVLAASPTLSGTINAGGQIKVGDGAKIGQHPVHGSGWAYWGHSSTADNSSGYGLLQNATGTDTRVNAEAGGQIGFYIANALKAYFDSSGNLVVPQIQSSITPSLKLGQNFLKNAQHEFLQFWNATDGQDWSIYRPANTRDLFIYSGGVGDVLKLKNSGTIDLFNNLGVGGQIGPGYGRFRLALGGGTSAVPAAGIIEVWDRMSISGSHSFGSFPDPGAGGLYAVGAIQTGGTTRAGASGYGYALLSPGNNTGGGADNKGYIAWHKADGTRHGYMGWDTTNIDLQLENGAGFYVKSASGGVSKSVLTSTGGSDFAFNDLSNAANHYAIAQRNNDTSALGAGGWTALTFDAEVQDRGGLFTTGSGDRFTIAVAGVYSFSVNVAFAASSSGERGVRVYRYNSGGTQQETVALVDIANNTSAGNYTQINASAAAVTCAAGDTIRVEAFTSVSLAVKAQSSVAGTRMSIVRIG